MSILRRTLIAASNSTFLERQATSRAVTRRIARRFIAGETLADGIAAVRRYAAQQKTATLDYLGEAVDGPGVAREAQRVIVEACRRIAEESLPAGVSVKPTQMGLRFDPDLAFELLCGIASAAAASGAHVTLDMEDSSVTEATVALCERLREAGHANVGCAVQAYLRRTPDDIERLSNIGTSLRLTKGAYVEPPEIAFQDRREVNEAFARLAEQLLRNGHYPRIATHDEALIERTKNIVIRHGLSPTDFEFQMLHGVREPLQDRLVTGGWRLRVYIPFGTQWYRYFMRRLAERPANLVLFFRAMTGS